MQLSQQTSEIAQRQLNSNYFIFKEKKTHTWQLF